MMNRTNVLFAVPAVAFGAIAFYGAPNEIQRIDYIQSAKYRAGVTVAVDTKLIVGETTAMYVPSENSKTWYAPKTARGRRIMELRRLAEEAGEEFLSSEELMAALRKNRT